MSFEDTLLKIGRKYSENELLQNALNQNQKLKIEIGKLKSYIHELEDKIDSKRKLSKQELQQLKSKGWVKQFLKDELIIELKSQIASLRNRDLKSEIKKEKHLKEEWRDKYFNEIAKNKK